MLEGVGARKVFELDWWDEVRMDGLTFIATQRTTGPLAPCLTGIRACGLAGCCSRNTLGSGFRVILVILMILLR